MSRSKKKTPIIGHAGNSEKSFKKYWHGLNRSIIRNQIKKVFSSYEGQDDIWFPNKSEEIINIWAGNKDGKSYIKKWNNSSYFQRLSQKDFEEYVKKMMRK